jgi:hypothetical protein
MTVTVLDPTARSSRKRVPMAIRPSRLDGKTLGIISNKKPGGDWLLDEIAEALNERFRFARILRHKKRSHAFGIDEDSLNEFSLNCDLVIVGVSD